MEPTMELEGGRYPTVVGGSSHGSHAMQQLQTNHMPAEDAPPTLIMKPAPPIKRLPKQLLDDGSWVEVWLPGDQSGWRAAVYAGCPEGAPRVLLAGESRFIDAPVGTKFRPIYSFQEGDHMVTDPMVSDDLMLKLLRTSDGKPRNSYSHIEALSTPGPTPLCGADCPYAHWTAVVKGQGYGHFHSQAVAAHVADCVRLHFDPDTTQLNFTPEVWQQVASQLDPAELLSPEAIQVLIEQTTASSSQAPSQGCVGPIRRNQSHSEQQQQQQQHKYKQNLCYQPYGRPTIKQHRHPSSSSSEAPGAVAAPGSQPSPAAGCTAHTAAAAAATPTSDQLCRTLSPGDHVSLCGRRLSASGQWVADGSRVELEVQAPLGCGGNAEVYKVKVISHSPAAGAAAGQQEADASANDSAANAAAADAPVLGAPCSYMPGQQFALKIPRAYQSLPPAEQQRWDATGYFLNSHMVLQQEQKLLSCVAHSDCVLHCHAYGVVKYGLFGLQELPCLLLELGDGSVLQRLEEYQAAAAAAATGPACRPVGLPDGEVWQIIRHVLTGLTDLSKAHIAWKDLKLSNILYVTRGERESIVLCDFGSGVLVGEDGLESAPAPAGTEGFVSPELKYGRRVGTACDVWGVGCLLLALRLGRGVQLLPDVEPDGAAASWDAAAVLHEVESELLPVELAFVARCLSYDPAGRPSPWDLQWCEYADNVPASLGGNVGGEELNAFISQIVTAGMAAAD